MRWTNRVMAVGLLGLVALTIAGTAVLTPGEPTPEAAGPVGSGLSTSDTDGLEPDSADETVITLGDLDPPPAATHPTAPIDPCTVVDRDDLPIDVRPAEHPVRTPHAPADGGVGCRLEYRNGPSEAALIITITWAAAAPGPLDSTNYPGATAVTVAGRPGLERAATDTHGATVCLGLMSAAGGTVSARVSNTRYPAAHPCTVTRAVLTTIAHTNP